MRNFLIFIFTVLIFSGCKPAAPAVNTSEAKRYPFKGKVISVDRAAKTATIAHDDIPGYMPAMTMPFPIHEDWVWDELAPGAEIRAELVVDNTAKDPYYLESIGIVAASNPNHPTPTPDAALGKTIPDFKLTNQDGRQITPKDFRGKAWAITFIYAKCPLPDYCVRMSTHFSDLANQLKMDAEYKDKIRLLSISFDPENDTPAKLRSYGSGYLGNQNPPDFSVWQLAVGANTEIRRIATFFGLDYRTDENNKTVINHNLRTAVISPEGKVTKIFSGNEWTTAELLNELKVTLH